MRRRERGSRNTEGNKGERRNDRHTEKKITKEKEDVRDKRKQKKGDKEGKMEEGRIKRRNETQRRKRGVMAEEKTKEVEEI